MGKSKKANIIISSKKSKSKSAFGYNLIVNSKKKIKVFRLLSKILFFIYKDIRAWI